MEVKLALGAEKWTKGLPLSYPRVDYGGAFPLVLHGAGRVSTCTLEGKARKRASSLGVHSKDVQAFAVAPGGEYAAGVTAVGRLFVWCLTADTIVWLPAPIDDQGRFPSPVAPSRKRGIFSRKQRQHYVRAVDIAVSAAGRRVAVQADDGKWWLWLGTSEWQVGRWVVVHPPRGSRMWRSERAGTAAVVASQRPLCAQFCDDHLAGARLQIVHARVDMGLGRAHAVGGAAPQLHLEQWHLPLARARGTRAFGQPVEEFPEPVVIAASRDDALDLQLSVRGTQASMPSLTGFTTTAVVGDVEHSGKGVAIVVNVSATAEVMLVLWAPFGDSHGVPDLSNSAGASQQQQQQQQRRQHQMTPGHGGHGQLRLCAIGAFVARHGPATGVPVVIDAVRWIADGLLLAVLLSSGHLAIVNRFGMPTHLCPDTTLGRVVRWKPTRGESDSREVRTLREAGVSTSVFFVPVFPGILDPSSKSRTSAHGDVALSLALHSSGHRLAVCSGWQVIELLLPPLLGVPFFTPELALDVVPELAWRREGGATGAGDANEAASHAMSRRARQQTGARSASDRHRPATSDATGDMADGSKGLASTGERWSTLRRQASAAAVASFLRRASIDSSNVGSQSNETDGAAGGKSEEHAEGQHHKALEWQLSSVDTGAIASIHHHEQGYTASATVRDTPLLVGCVGLLLTLCCGAVVQTQAEARSALLAAVQAMCGVLMDVPGFEVDGLSHVPDRVIASDSTVAFYPSSLPYGALATWGLLCAPEVPWRCLATQVCACLVLHKYVVACTTMCC